MGKAKILSGYINKGLGKKGVGGNVEEYEMRIRRSFYAFFLILSSGEFLKGAV